MKAIRIKPVFLLCVTVIAVLPLLTFVVLGIRFGNTAGDDGFTPLTLQGHYTVDGGEEVALTAPDEFRAAHYTTATVRGTLSASVPDDRQLILSVRNAWLEVTVNGTVVASNREDAASSDTPGYRFFYIDGKDIPDGATVEMRFENPYAKCFGVDPVKDTLTFMGYGQADAPYRLLFERHTVSVVIALAIVFLGVFTFSLGDLLQKATLSRNLSLALMAITGGFYALTDVLFPYLPLWIDNPALCMALNECTLFTLPVATFFFWRLNVETPRIKRCLTVLTVGAAVLGATAFLFQWVGCMDLLKSQYYLLWFVEFGIILAVVALIYEAFVAKSRQTRRLLLSMTPLILTTVFDALNGWFAFAPGQYAMRLGLFATVGIQLAFLIKETVRHNRELARAKQAEQELLQMRVAIMVSQIQPHFLYNALTSIAQLCEKDPKLAKTSVIAFAEYMRRNMNSLKEQAPVPFTQELEHLKTYVSLEKMRFGDDLTVVFDIEATDFALPSLTVQPLVENAVKHGVGMREDGGTVTVATREFDDRFEITVTDDGVGFDPSVPKDDGRAHVGMDNVRHRLQTMCRATLTVQSTVGEGTNATIIIPKEETP